MHRHMASRSELVLAMLPMSLTPEQRAEDGAELPPFFTKAAQGVNSTMILLQPGAENSSLLASAARPCFESTATPSRITMRDPTKRPSWINMVPFFYCREFL